MALVNVNLLLVFQVTTYVLLFFLSVFLFVPVAVHLHNFSGHCLLFSSGKWNTKGQLIVTWSSSAYCGYTIFVGVLLLLVSVIQIYRLSAFLWTKRDCCFLAAFVDSVGSIILTLMTLTGAIFITLGLKAWCDTITTRYISCKSASSNDLDEKDNIIIPGFYFQIGTAQFAAWSAWVCTVALAVFALLKMYKYHQQANIASSMAKESKRLLEETNKEIT